MIMISVSWKYQRTGEIIQDPSLVMMSWLLAVQSISLNIVKLRSRSKSGEGQEGQSQAKSSSEDSKLWFRFGPEQYPGFGFQVRLHTSQLKS